MRWIDKQLPPSTGISKLADELSTQVSFPEALANILVQRGYDNFASVRKFLKPDMQQVHDPFLMKDMDRAVDRILGAIENEEKILVYGDYDVDGTTSVTLLSLFLKDWGVPTEYYIPNRYTEGYGISFEGVAFAAEEGFDLIIALDCGTKAIDKSKAAQASGIDLIVVDHHKPGEEFPVVSALLNPMRDDCKYPDKVLSACALTLKLCQALHQRLSLLPRLTPPPDDYDPFQEYCDLATLSIACDIVPITGENRAIATHGLEKLRKNPLPGIAALMALSENERKWNISDLVFFLGPRINSAGRIRSARAAVQLLYGNTQELEAFAQALHEYNDERKFLDKDITDEATAMVLNDPEGQNHASTVLYKADWHKGVIGIVASRLIERFHRPTLMLTRSDNGQWVGSGRSVPGFDLYAALEACKDHLVQFGGHKYAAGMTLEEKNLEGFAAQFEEVVGNRITPAQQIAELDIAHRLDFSEVTPRFLRLLNRLAPFGPGNPEPVFLAEDVQVTEVRILKQDHVRFLLRQRGVVFEAIGFNLARRWDEVNNLKIHLAFQPGTKTWKGNTYIQLMVKDFKGA